MIFQVFFKFFSMLIGALTCGSKTSVLLSIWLNSWLDNQVMKNATYYTNMVKTNKIRLSGVLAKVQSPHATPLSLTPMACWFRGVTGKRRETNSLDSCRSAGAYPDLFPVLTYTSFPGNGRQQLGGSKDVLLTCPVCYSRTESTMGVSQLPRTPCLVSLYLSV